jgi:hypothetical protein
MHVHVVCAADVVNIDAVEYAATEPRPQTLLL